MPPLFSSHSLPFSKSVLEIGLGTGAGLGKGAGAATGAETGTTTGAPANLQGAAAPEEHMLAMELPQQLDFPPGRSEQPIPPQDWQLFAQHDFVLKL
jgi:hypothetical protein